MGASITLAGESLIAQKQGQRTTLDVARFVLAHIPGLDTTLPVDRNAGLPPAEQVVHVADVSQRGYLAPNQVVYSLQLDSSIGDFDFNWIGLETVEDVLLVTAYVPLQMKRREIPPLQTGNNLTRNIVVKFDGAQSLTGITVEAGTWQHDFTARLTSIDERERLSNRDIYGRSAFFDDAFRLIRSGSEYHISPGIAYINGVRISLTESLSVAPVGAPNKVWIDVALVRNMSDVQAHWKLSWESEQVDYVDSNGTPHYCVELADIQVDGSVLDLRKVKLRAGTLNSAGTAERSRLFFISQI